MGKKIVGIVSFMNAAGAQEALLRLMRQLRHRGHETEVWFLYAKSSCYRGMPGVRVILDKAYLSPFDIPILLFRLLALFRQTRPDAAVGFLPLANILGMTAAWVMGVPLRIASQRAPEETFGHFMQLFDRQLGARGVYSKVICVSRAVQESFADYPEPYRSRLSVVNNGIEWTPSDKEKAAARASFGVPDNYPLLVATGRFVPQKNYDLMVRVIATTPRIRLAIAGDGPLRDAAESLAQDLGADDRIHFLGSLPHDRIADLLRAADGFVQTSLFEGQSNSVLEAMHEGLPIICSDIPMQRETVCEENGDAAALLVPLEDFEAWRTAFLHLRDDRAFAEETGARAKALVSRCFTLNRMIDGFETAILETEKRTWVSAGKSCAVERADFTP
ncbi:MAG TPA: glycosyltransferase family 4 protein [Rhizomicrobium sp.]|nr:glycosyltransferase family 4 protein [Rhizomicrobium sp.]